MVKVIILTAVLFILLGLGELLDYLKDKERKRKFAKWSEMTKQEKRKVRIYLSVSDDDTYF